MTNNQHIILLSAGFITWFIMFIYNINNDNNFISGTVVFLIYGFIITIARIWYILKD